MFCFNNKFYLNFFFFFQLLRTFSDLKKKVDAVSCKTLEITTILIKLHKTRLAK